MSFETLKCSGKLRAAAESHRNSLTYKLSCDVSLIKNSDKLLIIKFSDFTMLPPFEEAILN